MVLKEMILMVSTLGGYGVFFTELTGQSGRMN